MSYTQLFPYLVHVGAIVPKEIPLVVFPYPPKHNPNVFCAFHAGHIGHSIEGCFVSKNRVQELIDQDILSFTEEKPNVKTNLLPNHGSLTVNTVLEEEETEVVSLVGDLKTPLSIILANLQKHGVLTGVHDNCDICKTEPDKREELKGCVQELMNQGVLQFTRARVMKEVSFIEPIEIVYQKKKIEAPMKKIQPIYIRAPSPFPYQDSKEVPWKDDATIYVDEKEIQFSNTKIVNIAGMCGMTRSGCVFAPKYTPKVIQAPVVIPTPPPQAGTSGFVPTVLVKTPSSFSSTAEVATFKGKEVVQEQEQIEKLITVKEGQEFIKLIEKSDFKIVD